jgi:hypothetical protein
LQNGKEEGDGESSGKGGSGKGTVREQVEKERLAGGQKKGITTSVQPD